MLEGWISTRTSRPRVPGVTSTWRHSFKKYIIRISYRYAVLDNHL
jgi:hypothetical protein